MNVNEARIFTTPALHAKSTRKDVLSKLTFHFKPKLKVFNQTKYLIQNINRHIKRILLFLKLLAILYVVTFVVFIGFTVLQIAIYHFRLAVHMTYSVLLSHDDVWVFRERRRFMTTESRHIEERGRLGTIHPWCIAQSWSSLLDVTEQRRNREGCEGTPALSVFAIFSSDKNG